VAEKKVNIPFLVRFIPWLFPKIESISSSLANKLAVRLFFTPFRFKTPKSEVEFIKLGKTFEFEILNKKKVKGHSFGDGPTIVCIHGWAGRGSQFRKFVEPLTNSGYRVILFDGPAHGKSDGLRTDPMQFEQAILRIEELFHPVAGYITHSFGGTAILFTFSRGLTPKPTVFIAVPALGEDVLSTYANRINASKKILSYFENYILEKYGRSFYEISAINTAKSMNETPGLVIQDTDDTEIPPNHGEKLAEALPNGNLFVTRGLGHSRVLRADQVVEETVAFLKNHCSQYPANSH